MNTNHCCLAVMTSLQCRAESEGGRAMLLAQLSLSPSLPAQHFQTYSISAMWEELLPCQWRATHSAQISRYSRSRHVSSARTAIQTRLKDVCDGAELTAAACWLAVDTAAPAKHHISKRMLRRPVTCRLVSMISKKQVFNNGVE